MKRDYRKESFKRDMQRDKDEESPFHHIAMICLMFAGLTALVIIGFSF